MKTNLKDRECQEQTYSKKNARAISSLHHRKIPCVFIPNKIIALMVHTPAVEVAQKQAQGPMEPHSIMVGCQIAMARTP